MRLLLLATLTISLVLACSGAPRDLIMGREFLSLVMRQQRDSDPSPMLDSSTSSMPELPAITTTEEALTTLLPVEEEISKTSSPEPSPTTTAASSTTTLTTSTSVSISKFKRPILSIITNAVTPSAVERSQFHAEEPLARVQSIIKKGRRLSSSSEVKVTPAAVSRSQFHADEPTSKVARHYAASERVAVRLAPAAAYTRFNYRQHFPATIKTLDRTRKIYHYQQPVQTFEAPEQIYEVTDKIYQEHEKVFGQREKVYAEPEKIYGEPEKVYGEPEKVYGEPEKVYGQPEKVYGEPEKVYGTPEQVHIDSTRIPSTTEAAVLEVTTPDNKLAYVVETEKISTGPTTQSPSTTEPVGLKVFDRSLEAVPTAASRKFGYVVEGRECRRYRVEERTPDGFIVGEYGVVSLSDGEQLERGVRYTADLTATNPRLIYDALMRFLSL